MAWPTSKRHSDAASLAMVSLARVNMAKNEVIDGSLCLLFPGKTQRRTRENRTYTWTYAVRVVGL
jgi:hypothetical protein